VIFAIEAAAIRGLADIEALERVPLEARIDSWDVNMWIRRGFALAPEKPAILSLDDADPAAIPRTVTYGALSRRVTQIANLFHAMGVRKGDAVFYLLPNVPQLFMVQLAALSAGIACGINWMLKPDQLAELVRAADVRLIVALGPTPGYEIWENVQAVVAAMPKPIPVISVPLAGGTALDDDLETLADRRNGDALYAANVHGPDDIAAYIHSGGTTGAPKLVKVTHRGLVYKCWAATEMMAHTSDDVIFADYPMFHIAGFLGRGVLPAVHGMTIAIPTPLGAREKRFVQNYWQLVEKFGITVFSGVPTTLAALAKTPLGDADTSSLRPYATTGSTALPVTVAEELERMIGVRLLLTYGSTEYCQNVTQAPRDGEARYGSAGIRLPYTQIRIVELDDDGKVTRECATGEIGVVIVRSPGNTPGYVDPRYDAGFFTAEGWINSGDLGRFDEAGYLWLTGRAKDLIIRGGHNIDPQVIEEALLKHPAVFLAAAVGRPDSYAGEVPVAYVQLLEGAAIDGEALRLFVRETIAERAAAPVEIFVLDELPLTDVRKPAKAQLRYDAARREVARALAAALGEAARIAVTVGPDAVRGTLATISVRSSDAAIERRVAEAMAPYTLAWRIVPSE
jgi:fatty-acyl-CoA synthase